MDIFRIILSTFLITTILSSNIMANDALADGWETGSKRSDRLIEEFEEGKWNEFLEENEVKYLNYINEQDPLLMIQSIDHEKRSLLSQKYLKLFYDRRKQVAKIYEELKTICNNHNIDSWTYFNLGGNNSDPIIIKMAGSMSVQMLVLSLTSPELISFMHQLELGEINEENLSVMNVESLVSEIVFFAEKLMPIQVEFTVRSFLAEQGHYDPDTSFILECEKNRRMQASLYEILGDEPEDGSNPEFYESNTYIVFEMFSEFSEACFIEFMLMDSFDHDFHYLYALATGSKEPSGAIEEECIPVLLKHRNILSEQWTEKVKALKYSYLLNKNM